MTLQSRLARLVRSRTSPTDEARAAACEAALAEFEAEAEAASRTTLDPAELAAAEALWAEAVAWTKRQRGRH